MKNFFEQKKHESKSNLRIWIEFQSVQSLNQIRFKFWYQVNHFLRFWTFGSKRVLMFEVETFFLRFWWEKKVLKVLVFTEFPDSLQNHFFSSHQFHHQNRWDDYDQFDEEGEKKHSTESVRTFFFYSRSLILLFFPSLHHQNFSSSFLWKDEANDLFDQNFKFRIHHHHSFISMGDHEDENEKEIMIEDEIIILRLNLKLSPA